MLSALRTTPRDASARAAAGKLSFFAMLAWLLLQPFVVWAGNPLGGLVVLTLVSWGLWALSASAVVLPRAALPLLLLVGTVALVVVWLLVPFLPLFFVPALGGSLALWLYWRDLDRRPAPEPTPEDRAS